jgi:hypothetical protein
MYNMQQVAITKYVICAITLGSKKCTQLLNLINSSKIPEWASWMAEAYKRKAWSDHLITVPNNQQVFGNLSSNTKVNVEDSDCKAIDLKVVFKDT